MGKTTITTTTYSCDICNKQSQHDDFNNGSICGNANITVKGSWGGKGYDGAWGGFNFNNEFFTCFECSEKVRGFIRDLQKLGKEEAANGTT